MRYYFSFLIFLVFSVAYQTAFSQSVILNYAKGKSEANFDLPAQSSLYDVYEIAYKKNKHTFGVNYSMSNFEYDKAITSKEQLLENFSSDINTFGIRYNYWLGNYEKLTFDIGLSLSFSEFSSSANLSNKFGQKYEDYDFEEWEGLGYFSDTDYETDFSKLNPDEIDNYPDSYFSFGPTLTSSYELLKNVSVFVTSTYRKNLTDLLDNTSVNNKRDLSANSSDDNQFDFFVGISFNLTNAKKMDNDSLMNYIESITNDDVDSQQNEDQNEDSKIGNSSSNTEIISREEYILGYFDTEEEVVNEGAEETIGTETTNAMNSALDSDSLSREEYILSYFDIPSEGETVTNNDELSDNSWESEEENNDSQIMEDDTNISEVEGETSQSYYLIVGVFSQRSNLNRMADSLQIKRNNFISKNNLYYLYVFETQQESEARQLRDSLEVESWILLH